MQNIETKINLEHFKRQQHIASHSETRTSCTLSMSTPANPEATGEETENTGESSKSETHTGETKPLSTHSGGGIKTETGEQTSSSSKMASNTLANMRACVKEFDTDQTGELASTAKRFRSWLENFEACADFEDISPEKRRPALLALGGEKFRELCKTLDITSADSYAEMVEKLKTHYTPQKNTSAERFKFFNMRPESSEETHDRWVTRMKSSKRAQELPSYFYSKYI